MKRDLQAGRFLPFFFLLCLGGQGAWAQDVFVVEVERMEPNRWASQSLPPGYCVRLCNDSVFVDLPYRGVAHRPQMEQTVPRFAAGVRDLSVRKGKKGRVELNFSAAWHAAWYRFRVLAGGDGRAQIHLSPSHAESIRYEGRWEGCLPNEKERKEE